MTAKRNKITWHQTLCLECGHHWNPTQLQIIMQEQSKESIHMKCFCGTRLRIVENVNGWLVFRRYIKKKDRVKRATK